jgi:hypothetical protein
MYERIFRFRLQHTRRVVCGNQKIFSRIFTFFESLEFSSLKLKVENSCSFREQFAPQKLWVLPQKLWALHKNCGISTKIVGVVRWLK